MTKDIFREWTLKKLEENPKLFGGDNGNPAIIKEYLRELHQGTTVEDLPLSAISKSVAVSRMRNKLLEVYSEYDHREKHVPKYKRYQEQEPNPSLFDDVA